MGRQDAGGEGVADGKWGQLEPGEDPCPLWSSRPHQDMGHGCSQDDPLYVRVLPSLRLSILTVASADGGLGVCVEAGRARTHSGL